MRILIDARFWGLENAGLGRYTINLIRQLSVLDDKNEYLILLRKKYFDSLNFPQNFQKVLAEIPHYSLAEQTKLNGIIKNQNPDVVHFLHFNAPLTYKGPFVVTIHDMLMHKFKGGATTTRFPLVYLIKRLGYRFIFRHSVLGSEKIITPSEYVKKEISSYYKVSEDKLVVTYEGIDESIVTDKDPKEVLKKYGIDRPYFIYVGNAYPHKNLPRAIEAVISLNKQKSEKALLVIVSGRSIFSERLEKTVKKIGGEGFVKILNFIPDSELASLYKHSVGFIFPSLSEGFGLPGLEAIFAGTIALVSDIPALRETYKDSVIYFNPLDFSSIEAAMEYALKLEEEKRQELISYGQKFAKRYSWTKMAKQTLKVYESCFSLRQGK